MWLLGEVVRRYIDFLILLIPTPLVYVLFCISIPTFCSFKKMFFYIYSETNLNYLQYNRLQHNTLHLLSRWEGKGK